LPPELTAVEVAATPSAMRTVWNSPLYRGATAALFLSGLGTSAAAPQITLFLVNDLHVSLTTAGLYYLAWVTLSAGVPEWSKNGLDSPLLQLWYLVGLQSQKDEEDVPGGSGTDHCAAHHQRRMWKRS
jgi:hypothetical protein